eukprot:TRINITY_DN23300_c0_g1_i1.p1 TRINITY_DN23300_c0_g1~~TRINITY_DN23300_c0_g1_i1.p1  ORF type:complete len:296 (+),score=88.91 TRINITY_DN23300_c0_g1_i1:48-890(+)
MARRTRSATTICTSNGDAQKRSYTPEIKTNVLKEAACHVIDVWAWRYGKDREWKSVRECKMEIANHIIKIKKDGRLLQEVAFGDIDCVYNYITSSRLIVGTTTGSAMFLSLDKKDHARFQELMQVFGVNSKPVSYGEFFRQQKSLIFPAFPVDWKVTSWVEQNKASQGSSAAGSGSGTPTAGQTSEAELMMKLQQQLEELKTKNTTLSNEMNRLHECQKQQRLLHHPHIVTAAPFTPDLYQTCQYTFAVPQERVPDKYHTRVPYGALPGDRWYSVDGARN